MSELKACDALPHLFTVRNLLKVGYQWNGNQEEFKPCRAHLPNSSFLVFFKIKALIFKIIACTMQHIILDF